MLLERGNLARYRAQNATIKNRAVFEIPDILRRIVEESTGNASAELEKSLSEQRA